MMADETYLPPNTPADERRIRVLQIAEREVVGLLLGLGLRLPEYVSVPIWDLPAGTRLEGVVHNPLNRTFEAKVSHESFDPVPDGGYFPPIPQGQVTCRVRLVPVDEKIREEPR